MPNYEELVCADCHDGCHLIEDLGVYISDKEEKSDDYTVVVCNADNMKTCHSCVTKGNSTE